MTALIGPSGCGKSTFLRALNRMNDTIEDYTFSGEVLLGGRDVRDMKSEDLRKRVGMVFQKPNPFPFSIFDNVAYGPRIHGIKSKSKLRDIVESSLTQAGLWDETKDILNRSAMALSGGQQQRLCIARSLAVAPEVLLMDEPTSALDPISTAAIEDLIKHLKANFTVVIVTHNMEQAVRVSDNTAFFFLGEIVEAAPTKTLFDTPKDQRTRDYIGGHFG